VSASGPKADLALESSVGLACRVIGLMRGLLSRTTAASCALYLDVEHKQLKLAHDGIFFAREDVPADVRGEFGECVHHYSLSVGLTNVACS